MTTRFRRQDNTLIWVLVGGGIALLAALFAILLIGVGLFFVLRSPARGTGGPSALAPPILKPASGRDRLIGTWWADIGAQGMVTMELVADGAMIVTVNRRAGGQAIIRGSWAVVSESGNKVRFRRIAAGSTEDTDLEFVDPNTFTILGPGGRWLTYHRR